MEELKFSSKAERRIFRFLKENPRSTKWDIYDEMGYAESVIDFALESLVKQDRILLTNGNQYVAIHTPADHEPIAAP